MNLLERYVQLHNEGVRTGSFAGLMELFSLQAVLSFEGIPLGPFEGRDAIARAFAKHPPDDLLVLVDPGQDGRARYAWRAAPEKVCGSLEMEVEGGRIVRLVIARDATA